MSVKIVILPSDEMNLKKPFSQNDSHFEKSRIQYCVYALEKKGASFQYRTRKKFSVVVETPSCELLLANRKGSLRKDVLGKQIDTVP